MVCAAIFKWRKKVTQTGGHFIEAILSALLQFIKRLFEFFFQKVPFIFGESEEVDVPRPLLKQGS